MIWGYPYFWKHPDTVDNSEIWRSPVEGKVVEIPLFTKVLAPSQVVGLVISEPEIQY